MPDAVLVPGGGVRDKGDLPPWVVARLEKAIAIAAGAPIVALSAATPHKAPAPVFESVAGAGYLLGRGYPREKIFVETASYDTIGNAWFARLVHTDPAGWRDLCVVTSDFHMPRTEAVFRWIFGAVPAGLRYELAFVSTPAEGLPGDSWNLRAEKERRSLAAVLPLTRRYSTLAEIHAWIYSAHELYAAGLSRTSGPHAGVLQSY